MEADSDGRIGWSRLTANQMSYGRVGSIPTTIVTWFFYKFELILKDFFYFYKETLNLNPKFKI